MKITVLGTGLMGVPLAERLASQGYSVGSWNRTAGKAGALIGVEFFDSITVAIERARVIVLALSDYDAISEVLFGAEVKTLLAGRAIIQMGTIAPTQSRKLAEEIASFGGEYLEAPVLGSIPEARQGSLIVMVGGEQAVFDRWLELLKNFGPKPLYIGAVGQAATIKLALNQLIAGLTTSFALSLGLVRHSGLDVERFMEILRESALYAPTFDKKLQRMLDRDYANPNFPVRHLLKDVNLFLDAGGEAGLDGGALLAIRELLLDSELRGLEAGDYSAVYDSIDPPV